MNRITDKLNTEKKIELEFIILNIMVINKNDQVLLTLTKITWTQTFIFTYDVSFPGRTAADCPDLTARVFKLK